jgi:hypothetical protein
MVGNMSDTDRLIRVLLVFAILFLFGNNFVTGTISLVLLCFAAVLLITSAMGYCPLYSLIGLGAPKSKGHKRSQ